MSLSIYMKGDYKEFYALGRRKNKAKQSQSLAFGRKAEILNEIERVCLKKQTQC